MASAIAVRSAVAAPLALAAAVPGASASEPSSVRAFGGLKSAAGVFSAKTSEWRSKTVNNGSRVNCCMQNLKHETLSYLPPLSPEEIAKEVDYLLRNGWIPCIEFDQIGYVHRTHLNHSGYYDGRYWTMWKLPMFGCNDASQVLAEIEECKKAYPSAYVRILGFDNVRQVQCSGFLASKPS
ncbi:hypothetical protein O6H91_20G074600 [Diphasiastrum complanatum]|uniref:Uncharacterized protein n=1 Tax=Diphasiastrum complanatum TaxID=34168 RepID=A0ACC2ART9_DIPCM|nr:hypothetical protein O6H91_20G074600 [Diphasiastrum complanatum]